MALPDKRANHMAQPKYDWRAAREAISDAISELQNASRHMRHGKRVNVLIDLLSAAQSIEKAQKALEPSDAA